MRLRPVIRNVARRLNRAGPGGRLRPARRRRRVPLDPRSSSTATDVFPDAAAVPARALPRAATRRRRPGSRSAAACAAASARRWPWSRREAVLKAVLQRVDIAPAGPAERREDPQHHDRAARGARARQPAPLTSRPRCTGASVGTSDARPTTARRRRAAGAPVSDVRRTGSEKPGGTSTHPAAHRASTATRRGTGGPRGQAQHTPQQVPGVEHGREQADGQQRVAGACARAPRPRAVTTR